MPSTYSSSLRLELQATGENANTWGTKTNNNLELIEQAIAGYVKITLTSASATYPLVIADASASDGRNAYIEFVGTVASAISITVPDVEKGYWVKNSATGSPLTFRTSSGTGVVLPTNQWVNLVSDGASITSTFPTSITGYALLSATQTFTGANTFTSLVNIQSNLSVTGNAFVSGVTTLASAVDIKGATSLASTLVVGGAATFNSNVSVSGVMVVGAGAVGAPSYSTTGDTNTGIYFPAADTIAVATSGTERMRIDNAGNVGIATTSPSSFGKFAVQGASNTRAFYADALAQPVARYDDNSYVSNGLTIRNTGISGSNQGIGLLFQLGAGGTAVDSGAIQMRSEADYSTAANQDAAMAFFTAANGTNSERMRIDSSGNVGIGTTSPGAKLEVAGTLTATGNTINFGGNDATNTIMNVGGVPTGNKYAITDYIGDSTYTDFGLRVGRVNDGANGTSLLQHRGTGPMILDVFDAGYLVAKTNSTERMRINSSGNVGIGTGSPAQRLHIATTAAPSGTTQTFLRATADLGYGADFGGGIIQGTGAIATISTVDNGTATERMRIDSSGNVGIGTTGPVGRLDVRGSNSATFALFAGTTKGVRFNIDSNVVNLEGVDNTGVSSYQPLGLGGSVLQFSTGATERMRIDSSGNVGIGTSSPSYRLQTLRSAGTQSPSALTRGAVLATTYTRSDNSEFVGRQIGIGVTEYASFIQAEDTSLANVFLALNPNGGNVGIGTASPSNGRLHVVGAGGAQGVKIENTSTSLSAAAGLTLRGPAGTARSTILAHSNSNAGGSTTQFYIAQQDSSDAYVQTLTLYDYPTNTWLFYTNNSERMRIDSSGRVGIGTSSPGYALDVAGALALGGSIYTGRGISTADVSLELGEFRTGSGPTYIDLHSVSGSDYEARFIRNGGANGSCAIYNTGTGLFELTQQGAGDLYFGTNGSERMRIDSNGNVRVGAAALATTATNGFLYVPTCAGTPTGTPTAITGLAPIVINTTNNKLYFYSGGAWRDAGP